MKLKKTEFFILLFVLALAVFLRVYHLEQQGLFFYDEGAMVTRIQNLGVAGSSSYIDSKVLWLACLVIARSLCGNAVYAAQYTSVVFGVLTIFITFLFARRRYHSNAIGIISAFLLSISSYHVFYSRLAMPESASIFFFMLTLYIYTTGERQPRHAAALAGICASAAFLLNRFRVGLLPLFILILQITPDDEQQGARTDKWKYLVFLMSALAVLLFVAGAHHIFRFAGFSAPSYIMGLKEHIGRHAFPSFGGSGFLAYPFYLLEYEGPAIVALLIAGFFFLRRRRSPAVPLLFIFVQLFFSALMDERGARNICVVLPFVAIAASVSLYNLYCVCKDHVLKKIALASACVLVVAGGMSNALSVTFFTSDMKMAMEWLHDKDAHAKVVSTNAPVSRVWAPSHAVRQLIREDMNDFQQYARHKAYLIVDPEKFVANTQSGMWSEPHLMPLLKSIEDVCEPVVSFDNFNDRLLQRFLFEHTRDFSITAAFARRIQRKEKQYGGIRIYEIAPCAQRFAH